MWTTKTLRVIADRPMNAVGFILAVTAFLTGIYLMLIGLQISEITTTTPLSARISGLLYLPFLFGIVQVALGSVWLVAIFNKKRPWSLSARKNCSMAMFLIYTFYAFSGAILEGFTRISWVSTIAIALIAAVNYLRLTIQEPYRNDDGV